MERSLEHRASSDAGISGQPKHGSTDITQDSKKTKRQDLHITSEETHGVMYRILAGPTGIEPATPGLKVRCSSLTELRALSVYFSLIGKTRKGFFSVSIWLPIKKIIQCVVCTFSRFVMKPLILSLALSIVSIVFWPFSVSL